MPTLLEKSPEISAAASTPVHVLKSRHRWESWRGVLIALFLGLALTLLALAVSHYAWPASGKGLIIASIWAGGVFLTLVASAVAWRFAPASLAVTAQVMDRHFAAKNRLEAAASLHESTSPLAQAQRDETASYLQTEPRVRPVRIAPWLVGGVLVLVLAHVLTLLFAIIPSLLHSTPPAPVPPPPPKEIPHASITWRSPEPETKANPIEEVPTVAVAQSTTGLKDLTLEVSVNGESKKSTPLPAQPFDQPGKNTIKVSIYLDELGVQPFDVVSYFLRAQRITDQKVPDTTSAIQFIQVRPFRDDAVQVPPGIPMKNYDLLVRLKLAQLRAIKENFVLAHTDLAVTDPVRVTENNRVGKDQGDLSTKTEEVVQAFIQDGMPAEIVDLLRQAEVPMADASKKILATQNVPALVPQQKALSLLVAAEKYFVKIMSIPVPGPSSDNPEDPFKDKQQHEMKKRYETPAGQLEQLVQNQTKLAKDLNQSDATDTSSSPNTPAPQPASSGDQTPPSPGGTPATPAPGTTTDASGKPVPLPAPQAVDPFAPDSGKGTFAERQARVLQGIETLLNTNDVLPATVTAALQEAQKQATDSMHQLDQANNADAREPAAAAAEALQKALAEMNKAGDEQTKQAMEQGQQKLNDLSKQLSDLAKTGARGTQQDKLADQAAKAKELQKQLNDAADHQQKAGSANGAERLNHLANQIAIQDITKDLHDMSKSGLDPGKAAAVAQKLEQLAQEAAQGQNAGKPTAQDIGRLIAALEASRDNLARLAQKAGAPGTPNPGATPPTPNAPGTTPSPNQGAGQEQKQDNPPGQGQGQKPEAKQGSGQGDKPGNPTPQDSGQGKDQGQGQGQQPDARQGSGQGEKPGNPTPQGSGQSKDQGQGQGQGQQADPNAPPQPGGTVPGGDSGGDIPGSGPQTGTQAEQKAYNEVLQDLKDEAQQANAMLPNAESGVGVGSALNKPELRGNMVQGYQVLAPPIDQLIAELETLSVRTEREDIVKQPDLDEAPPAYRPAVSDYFENMSRDYHPDSPAPASAKP